MGGMDADMMACHQSMEGMGPDMMGDAPMQWADGCRYDGRDATNSDGRMGPDMMAAMPRCNGRYGCRYDGCNATNSDGRHGARHDGCDARRCMGGMDADMMAAMPLHGRMDRYDGDATHAWRV